MSIVRVSHDQSNPYVILNKQALADPNISWAAKGLWAFLMSKPDNWKVSVTHLSKIYLGKGGGRDAIYSLIKELIDNGYCKKNQKTNSEGKFIGVEYTLYEFKNLLPLTGNPNADVPITDKPDYTNKGSVLSNEKEQQQAAVFSKDKDDMKKHIEIYKCLENIDIPENEKRWLTQTYDNDTIKTAIKWATSPQTKVATTLTQAIKWACKNKPNIPMSLDDRIHNNKKLTNKMVREWMSPKNIQLEVLSKHVEFVFLGCNKDPVCIFYDDGNFSSKMKTALLEYRFCHYKDGNPACDKEIEEYLNKI